MPCLGCHYLVIDLSTASMLVALVSIVGELFHLTFEPLCNFLDAYTKSNSEALLQPSEAKSL
ncbi:hypothetical protein BELL_0452g00020 [Botrytis elliptica]|uniref:Uncharacterized protein n=1 Tax=Botrytis elliptica TaxID=278938 RepID=A0A4Z1JG45_9HELO|nr:hypothetical protein EAE99_004556 [Botrytis elliptica]TGO72456.1 hypothetical protein BELL_0452g00020 [Botrytis elliptica]